MIDLQKSLDFPNLCHLATKKIKSYYNKKYPTKDQIRKNKIKVNQWIDDDKSVYIREDLAYKLIRYNNLGVIKADEFRKSLGILNNQLVRREREIVASIMKIFAMECMIRQYKVDGLSYDVDLCFPVHQLIVEVDEDGHVYYDEEDHRTRQKLIENLDFTFIRINPDVKSFDLDVVIAKIYNYIKESSLKLAVNLAEKCLK